MVKVTLTLWECIERAPRPVPCMSLKTYLVHLLYSRGWPVYSRSCLNERRFCLMAQEICAVQRGPGRPILAEAAKRKMKDAILSGVPIQDVRNDTLSDMIIADAYLLIAKHWGFPQRAVAEALGEAAAVMLGRTCPYGKPLGGDRVKQLAEGSPLIRSGAYRPRQSPRENIAHFRPNAIQGYTEADLREVCRRVLECGGRTPPEWEDYCIF